MAIRKVKKTFAGYKEIPEEDYRSPISDYTHVIYDKGDHIKAESDLKLLRGKYEELKYQKERELVRLGDDWSNKLYVAERAAKEKLEDVQTELERSRQDAVQLADLNKNLIRIARERANADRQLIPKKKHKGYVLLSMEQTGFNIRAKGSSRMFSFPCWRLRLQSPYEVLIELASVKTLIYDDLRKILMKDMEIDGVYERDQSFESYSLSDIDTLWSDPAFIFKTAYKANAIKGFWEVEYFCNRSVKILPEMLPEVRQK